jgi:hypothetical protein
VGATYGVHLLFTDDDLDVLIRTESIIDKCRRRCRNTPDEQGCFTECVTRNL